MDFSVLLAVAVCLAVAYFVKKLFFRGKLPPGPIGLPFVGYLPFLSKKPYLDFQRLAKKYGDVFGINMGSEYVVVLNDYESTKEAFAKDTFIGRPKENPFNFNKETTETEAFDGLPWKEQRRFSLHMLRDLGLGKTKMEEHLQEEIDELLENLGGNVDKPFLINELIIPSMSNNISSLVFGKRLKYNDPDRIMMTRVTRDIPDALGQAAWTLFFPRIKKLFEFLGIGNMRNVVNMSNEMKKFIEKEIDEHEATFDPNNIRDYIDGYLQEIQKRKDDPAFCKPVLADMVSLFFGAGSETVRTSVEWLILTAAQFQDGQHRIQREIDEIIGRNKKPTWTDQKSMPYTQAFIMELNRWITILPINLVRYARLDGEISGYFIPRHTQILSNLWAVHHNPKYWGTDVEEFKPERFLTEDEKDVQKRDHYIPFSIGKRACPGEPLAKIEVFLYFTSILQRFNVRLPDGKIADFEGRLGISLSPKPQELIYTNRK